mgnify:FL=1|tara:strand:+ start:240 stop:779 length:540 start_codon:yes stop_codon:yes gene_type:complete
MSFGLLSGGIGIGKFEKSRIFVSYYHKGDQTYYDAFSTTFHDRYDVIYDKSLEREIDSENVDYVMRRIREEYITGSSCTIVLVGNETWRRKYVDWEIKATLDKEHGLIGVYLPTAQKNGDGKITVPDRLYDNIQSGYAMWLSWDEITKSAEQLQNYINQAKSKNSSLANNTRDRRLRNG